MLLPFHNQAIEIWWKFLSGVSLGGYFSKPEALLRGGGGGVQPPLGDGV